jgi:hypothetical protein
VHIGAEHRLGGQPFHPLSLPFIFCRTAVHFVGGHPSPLSPWHHNSRPGRRWRQRRLMTLPWPNGPAPNNRTRNRLMFPLRSHAMAAANASARGQRAAILASPLRDLTGFCLAVDCLAPGCGGERAFAVAELASFYGDNRTVGTILRAMRCSGGCGGRVAGAWLTTGPVLSKRVRPRRVPRSSDHP